MWVARVRGVGGFDPELVPQGAGAEGEGVEVGGVGVVVFEG